MVTTKRRSALVQLQLTTAAVVALLAGGSAVFGQTASTTSSLTMQGPAEQSGATVFKDAYGKPCLDVEAAARAEAINPDMKDHVVSIKNNCAKLIRAKVCYYNSDHCSDVVLQAYKRVDTILGTMRGVTAFRYTLTQK